MINSAVRPAAAAVVAVLIVLSAACRGADTGPSGGVLVVSVGADANSIFPPFGVGTQDRVVSELLYDKLADIGPSLNTIGDIGFEPKLARSWEWSRDSLTITFHLDPRARWHDGRPVTSADVQYAFRVWTDSAVGVAQRVALSSIDSISAPDALTARVHFRERTPAQFYALVYTLVPLPAHRFAAIADTALRDAPEVRAPIGSGPFRFVSWTPRARLELAANGAYYTGRPRLDGVVFVVAAQGATVAARLLAGEADFLEQLAPPDFAQLPADGSVRAQPYGGFDYGFVQFNLRDAANPLAPHALFGERAMRRALTMAVNRTTLVRSVFDTLGRPAIGPFSRTQWTADTTLRGIPFDSAGAAHVLDSLGWRDANGDGVRERNGRPLAFSLLVPASSRVRQTAAVLLQAQLKAVGVRVNIDQVDFNAWLDRAQRGAFDALVGAVRTSPSPRGVRDLWGTPGPGRGAQNWGQWSNATFDAQVDSALAATSTDAVRAHFRVAYQSAIDDAPAIWLYEPRLFAGVHRRLSVRALRPDAWWSGVASWSIDPAQRLPRDRRAATTP
ncbi:MAG: peptide ABC transporter substrate-binding protein [Gemmatimonadetes bacterium]|nr:peptide ABC transporter substrate-binding protein [Gemmatimonadota bacterium]